MTLRHTVEDSVEIRRRNERIAARKYLPIDNEPYFGRGLSSWSQITIGMEITYRYALIHDSQVKNINVENNTVCLSQLSLNISICTTFFGPEILPKKCSTNRNLIIKIPLSMTNYG